METWPLGTWVPAWSYLGGSCSRKAVAPNAVGPDDSPQTGCSCQHGVASEHRALGLSPPSCPFTVTLAHPLSTCACWSLLCKASARQTAWGSAPPCCPGAVSVWSEACLPCSSWGEGSCGDPRLLQDRLGAMRSALLPTAFICLLKNRVSFLMFEVREFRSRKKKAPITNPVAQALSQLLPAPLRFLGLLSPTCFSRWIADFAAHCVHPVTGHALCSRSLAVADTCLSLECPSVYLGFPVGEAKMGQCFRDRAAH